VIFRAAPDKQGPGHPGSRIAFLPDETLLLTIGEGYDYKKQAQELGSALGKVVRLDRDGHPASDNPFAGQPGARPEIWSYGHRNPQGLLVDPRDGAVWEHEHGPRGGDEINRVRPGLNYGWPRTTHGVDYSGEVISKEQTARGIEPPVLVWVPSIAPSGFALYLGDRFAGWKGDFFVGGLAERSLRRVRIRDGEVILQRSCCASCGPDPRGADRPDGFSTSHRRPAGHAAAAAAAGLSGITRRSRSSPRRRAASRKSAPGWRRGTAGPPASRR
jgi:glucose/arabinose dehydrogenase